jgi:hypothetical protein
VNEKDEFNIYSLNLRKYLSPAVSRKPTFIGLPILEILSVEAKLDVFTTGIFTHKDDLLASATFDQKLRKLYVLISS